MTVQEEIGTRGAITSAHSVNPQVALAFDVTHATDYPGIDKTKYGKIVCGQGPVIARGPNINPVVFEKLVAAAEAEKIPYQIEAEPSVTGTDARSIQVTRGGIPTGLVSVPLRYMHTPTEVVDLRDVEHAVALIVRFVESLSAHDCFVPGLGGTASEADLQEENNAVQAEAQVTPSPNETANARAEGSL
jgi:endoglucanase